MPEYRRFRLPSEDCPSVQHLAKTGFADYLIARQAALQQPHKQTVTVPTGPPAPVSTMAARIKSVPGNRLADSDPSPLKMDAAASETARIFTDWRIGGV